MEADDDVSQPVSFKGDAERVWSMVASIADISDTSAGEGVTRWAYKMREREAHALVTGWLACLGLDVHVDSVGNTIAELSGTRTDLPCIATGSHLDSVPRGGRFDGIARFGQGCIGSKAVGGMWSHRALCSIRDREGVSIAQAMHSMDLTPRT